MIIYILILLSVLILDVVVNYIIIKRLSPRKDWWKIPIWIVVTSIAIILAIDYALYQNALWWKAIFLLIPTGFVYSLLKNMALGILWHGNPFYLSENHFPDNVILKYFNNGYLYAFFLIVCAGFFSGLTRYICETLNQKKMKKINYYRFPDPEDPPKPPGPK